MKNLLVIFTVFAGMQTAQATSLMGQALSFERVQKNNKQVIHSLHVYVDGLVVDRGSKLKEVKVVTRLSADQMDRINRLIRRSTPVRKGFEPSKALCFAPSLFTLKYRADNTSVFLREGAICDGGFSINTRPAARKLVLILQALESAAHTKFTGVDLDEQLDNLLE